MPWFKVDDKLHDHRKSRIAGKAAMGVWVLAGSWSMDHGTDGFIPDVVLSRWGNQADAARLVAAGMWCPAERDGEQGWQFHDWEEFQPPVAALAAVRARQGAAGLLGSHRRWHKNGVFVSECPYCRPDPVGEPIVTPMGNPIGNPIDDPIGNSMGSRMHPYPVPTQRAKNEGPSPLRSEKPAETATTVVATTRPDITNLCNHLADRVQANTGKRPTITAKWQTDARLLLDNDKRPEQTAHELIDWATNDSFWRSNILSMPKFRQKYDQLLLQARRTNTNGHRRGDIDWDAAFIRAAARDAAEGSNTE